MQHQSIRDVLENFGRNTIRDLQSSIDKKGISATTKLRQSIDYRVKDLGESLELKLGWTGDADEYARVADKGRRPGDRPPIDAIRKWIAAKGIPLPDESSLRKKIRKGLKNRKVKKSFKQWSVEQRSKSLAYVIARKIGKEGTKASNFFTDVVNDSLFEKLKKDLATSAKKDILIELRST